MNTDDIVREELARITLRNGGLLTAELVVAEARKKGSPLHMHFQWDIKKAAYEHWLDQARSLIRSVRVVITNHHKIVETVAYVRDPRRGANEQGYASTVEIRSDVDLAREVLVSEFMRASWALRRARELAVAFDLTDDVDGVIVRVDRMTQKVKQEVATT